MRISLLVYLLFFTTNFISCTENNVNDTNDANNLVSEFTTQKTVDTFVIEPEANPGDFAELFTFHSKLLLNKDISFDVLGLGTPAIGSYLILKSDKRNGKYTSITGDKKGRIVHASATDMGADQQIEVIIVTKSGDNQQGNLIVHEIDSLNNHTHITLPELSSDLSNGYQGRDTFYVKSNRIIREFPVVTKSDGSNVASRKRIEYVLKNNTLLPSVQGQEAL